MDTGSEYSLKYQQAYNQELGYFTQIRDLLTEEGKSISLGSLLKRAANLFGSRVALIDQARTLTYEEFYFRAILLSSRLRQAGVKPGDKVFVYHENAAEFSIAYFAILQIGAIVAPINIFLHSRELAHVFFDACPAAVVTHEALYCRLEDIVENFGVQLPSCLKEAHFDWDMPINQEMIRQFSVVERSPDELSVLLYTSGTTGVPKGVMLSSRNALTNSMQSYARFKRMGLNDQERFFCVLPMFHVFAQSACLWFPLLTGATTIIVRRIDRRLIREGLEHKPTLFFGFPALFGLLCIMKNAPLDSVKLFVSGADMLPDKIRGAFALIYGRKIFSGYGLTEASPVVAVYCDSEDAPSCVVGTGFVGIETSIRDAQGQQVAQGEVGTLWVKGDNVMLGYYNAQEETDKILIDGWLNTGDLASCDEYGNLSIRGRSKDVIIHKGFNIYPAEVENILLMHPEVTKAAVIGRRDDQTGEIPIAFVAARVDGEKIEKKLRQLCANNLAAYKIPRKIICLDDLPMNATGKVDKKQLNA